MNENAGIVRFTSISPGIWLGVVEELLDLLEGRAMFQGIGRSFSPTSLDYGLPGRFGGSTHRQAQHQKAVA